MNSFKISLKNNKRYFKRVFILLLLGILIGFFLIKKLDTKLILENLQEIASYLDTNKINFLTSHLITILLLLLGSLTIVGFLLFPICFIYEGICIAFILISFTSVFKLKGLLYSLIYILITKGLYIFLLVLVFKRLIAFGKIIISKEKKEYKLILTKNIKIIGIYIMIIFFNDLILYLFGNKILAFFLFLIK